MGSSRIYYCPYCGYIYRNPFYQFKWTCEGCGARKVELKMFSHDDEYYENKSMEKYGNTSHDYEFLDIESSQNPLYDTGRANIRRRREAQRFSDYMEKRDRQISEISENKSCVPKCPTCGSTDIKKISVASKTTHAMMFGLLSKTARSQFECNNCHYKW